MTGVSPFAASSPAASLAAVLERHIDPDPRVEPRVWIELQRALSKRAYERHASAAELAAALRAAVGETEGTLAACLSLAAPPVDEPEADAAGEAAARGGGAPSIDGHSVALTEPRRRVRGAAWWVAGIAAGAVASVIALGIRASAPERGATSVALQAPVATQSATAVPTASAAAVAPGSEPTPLSAARPSSAATPTAAPSHRPSRPHAVATTPGF
jgi:hypothetical protein